MNTSRDFPTRYGEALGRFLVRHGELELNEAYELGHEAVLGGLGLLDLAAVHHDALCRWLGEHRPDETLAVIRTAGTFFAEILSSFEIRYRRIDESNAAWRHVNDLLESEIKRISRALHDEAGNVLAHVTLEMDLVMKGLPTDARDELGLARKLLDEAGEHLRHLSHELRPSILDDLGLVPAIEFLAEGMERRSGIRIEVQGTTGQRFTSDIELAAYRIVQEALNNTLRHGGNLSAVTVRLDKRGLYLCCAISDNGAGFDASAVMADSRRGLGLISMRERAAVFGGECAVVSAPGSGTTIEFKIPV